MSDHVSILPPNSAPVERAIEAGVATGKPDLAPISVLMDPETIAPELLVYLAWSLSVDEWDATWSDERKREVVKTALSLHRIKGTVKGVKDTLSALGYPNAQIVEGDITFQYDGSISYDGTEDYGAAEAWAEYRVYLTNPITIDQAARVKSALKMIAPARCHLKGLHFTEAAHRYNAAISYDGNYTHGVVA